MALFPARLVVRHGRLARAHERRAVLVDLRGKLGFFLEKIGALVLVLVHGTLFVSEVVVVRRAEALEEGGDQVADGAQRALERSRVRVRTVRSLLLHLVAQRIKVFARHLHVRVVRYGDAALLRALERAFNAAELAAELAALLRDAVELTLGLAHALGELRTFYVVRSTLVEGRKERSGIGKLLFSCRTFCGCFLALLGKIQLLDGEIRLAGDGKLLDERLGALKALDLLLQESDVRRDLAAQAFHLVHVVFCLLELAFSFLLLELKVLQAERVLEHGAAFLRRRDEDSVGLALRDDVMPALADVRAREQLLDVAQAHLRAVDEVLGRTVAEDGAFYAHLVEVDLREELAAVLRGVIEDDGDGRAVSARARMRAREDEVLAALAAHALHGLLAEREAERLGNVRLARPVRADNGGRRAREVEHGLAGE